MQLDPHPSRAATPRQTASAYLMSWVAVAAFGLGYIGVAATRPDLLGVILPMSEQSPDHVATGRTAADITDELATLRKWVHDLQHELAATKSTLQEQVAHGGVVAQRLAAAEERLGAVRDVRQDGTGRPAVQRLQGRAQAPTQAAPAQPVPVQAATAPADPSASAGGVRVLNNTTVAPIATGSVPDAGQPLAASPANGFGQAKVTPPPSGPRGIEIGSAESLDGLRARWSDISGRNAEVVGDLSPRYRLAADGRQTPFTLLAGPFENTADATRTCNTLRAKGVSCRVGAYSGNAF